MKKSIRILSAVLVLVLCLSVLPMGALAADADGWQKQSDGTWLYFKNGNPYTGWVKSGGYWYYLDPIMVTDSFYLIDGDWYYFNSSGKMATGWKWITEYYIDDDGNEIPFSYWAYFLSSGAQVTDSWKKINGAWYYFNEYGQMLSDGLYQFGSNLYYYFKPSGAMVTGWQKIPVEDGGTEWFYFLPSGAMKLGGWQQVGSTWYYFMNGYYYRDGLYEIENSTGKYYYYFTASGAMYTGWKYLDGAWRYFTSSNGMVRSDSLKIGGKYYAFKDYAMVTNAWDSGLDSRYYGSDGAALTNTTRTINGITYTFDSNGWSTPLHTSFNN